MPHLNDPHTAEALSVATLLSAGYRQVVTFTTIEGDRESHWRHPTTGDYAIVSSDRHYRILYWPDLEPPY